MFYFCGTTAKVDGVVAEWLGRGLQNLLQRFESAQRLNKSPSIFEGFFYVQILMNNSLRGIWYKRL